VRYEHPTSLLVADEPGAGECLSDSPPSITVIM